MEQVAFEKTFVAHYDAVEAFLKKKNGNLDSTHHPQCPETFMCNRI